MGKGQIWPVAALAALACLAAPASSSAAVSCAYSTTDQVLSVSAPGAFAGFSRSGDGIVVSDGAAPVVCSGGVGATVTNTARISVTGSATNRISLAGGPFTPGAVADPDAHPEVKFDFVDRGSIDIFGSGAADVLTLGPADGINLNGDADVDAAGPFTKIVLEGQAGDDTIAPQSDWTPAGALLIASGGAGNDTIVATPSGAVIHGGAGNDRLIGGRGRDNITGGRGKDVIRAGAGRDLIRVRDNTRDRVNCGAGIDRVKADAIDVLKHCERRIRKR